MTARELAVRILHRGPEILAEAQSAGYPRTMELYDEADEWRDGLRGMERATPLETATWRAAHAVIMAVSACYFEAPADHRGDPYFMEKRGEALIALDRLRRVLSEA